jgi:hypothetical protein
MCKTINNCIMSHCKYVGLFINISIIILTKIYTWHGYPTDVCVLIYQPNKTNKSIFHNHSRVTLATKVLPNHNQRKPTFLLDVVKERWSSDLRSWLMSHEHYSRMNQMIINTQGAGLIASYLAHTLTWELNHNSLCCSLCPAPHKCYFLLSPHSHINVLYCGRYLLIW